MKAERRILGKLVSILSNTSHSLHDGLIRLKSTFSGRLIQPSWSTGRNRRSIPANSIAPPLYVTKTDRWDLFLFISFFFFIYCCDRHVLKGAAVRLEFRSGLIKYFSSYNCKYNIYKSNYNTPNQQICIFTSVVLISLTGGAERREN